MTAHRRRRAALLIAAASAFLAASPASALQEPRPGPGDPRMRVIDASDTEVTRIVVTGRSTVKIILPPGERSVGASSGDTTQWEVVPAADKDEDASNILIVKPKIRDTRGGQPTPITIVSRTEDGRAKVREFEAVGREGTIELAPDLRTKLDAAVRRRGVLDPADDVMLSVTVVDRERAAKEARERREADARAREQETARHLQSVALYEGPRNWDYDGTESPLAEGLEVSDNGQQTVFRFMGNAPRPAIFLVLNPPATEPCTGKDEERVQRIPHGEAVIVPTTWNCFRLRSGGDVMDVRNNAYGRVGLNHGTGTNTPDVVRDPRAVPRPAVRTATR